MAENESKQTQPSAAPLRVIYQPIDTLRATPGNPRKHSRKQIGQIGRSIDQFGFVAPVLVDTKLNIIAGHGRVLAARQQGIAHIPTIQLSHLSEAQKLAYMIADNRLTENSVWDDKLLGEQLQVLSGLDLNFSIELTGFEIGEIDVRIEGLSATEFASDDADSLPETKIDHTVSKLGDIWQLGRHRVFCGSAYDAEGFERLMAGEKAAAAIIDPPFNVRIDGHVSGNGFVTHREFAMASGEMSAGEFTEFLRRSFETLTRYSRNGSLHYIFMDWRHLREALAAGDDVYTGQKNLCAWVKHNAGMGSLYRSQHELVLIYKHGRAAHRNNVELGRHGRHRSNVWNYPGANSFGRNHGESGDLLKLHPTVKPVAMIADAIMDCTARGELVIDSFLGSGTTLVSAEKVGRRCYGGEIDPAYVDLIIRRWQLYTGDQARHTETGFTFDETADKSEVARG